MATYEHDLTTGERTLVESDAQELARQIRAMKVPAAPLYHHGSHAPMGHFRDDTALLLLLLGGGI